MLNLLGMCPAEQGSQAPAAAALSAMTHGGHPSLIAPPALEVVLLEMRHLALSRAGLQEEDVQTRIEVRSRKTWMELLGALWVTL